MGIYDKLESARSGFSVNSHNSASSVEATPIKNEKYIEVKRKLQSEVIDLINRENVGEANIYSAIGDYIMGSSINLPRSERQQLIKDIYDDVVGLGPLESLMSDSTVTEIMVNGADQIYVERKGKIEKAETYFDDDAHVMRIIDRIVSRVGRRCDESNPMVDARLKDGSRVNVIIPPLALKGPTITIRRFNSAPLQIGDLVNNNSISFNMASFLEACVKGKANIVVAGGTGSGKTTLLNILSSYIPENERIVTIEDAAELQLKQDHVVTLESRPANIEGKGEIVIRDLVRNALRMRPDPIIVGEVRAGATLDMLQAMNTGHDGSLTTVHGNSPRDVISRMETMVLMGGINLPVRAIRDQISSAIDIIVYQTRFRDGSRRVSNISEVVGMEGDVITLQDIFSFKPEGVDMQGKVKGKFVSTGIRPKIVNKFRESGIFVRDDWFSKEDGD